MRVQRPKVKRLGPRCEPFAKEFRGFRCLPGISADVSARALRQVSIISETAAGAGIAADDGQRFIAAKAPMLEGGARNGHNPENGSGARARK